MKTIAVMAVLAMALISSAAMAAETVVYSSNTIEVVLEEQVVAIRVHSLVAASEQLARNDALRLARELFGHQLRSYLRSWKISRSAYGMSSGSSAAYQAVLEITIPLDEFQELIQRRSGKQ